MSKVIVVTSGKGGVGKTTTSASIACGLALKGLKTCVIDFDVGLRNLDLIMGVERRVVYDFVNVINGEASLKQALINDKRVENLYILPASQTRDKDALTKEGVGKVIDDLKAMDFEYIICDSPAGIEQGALMALYYADEAIITTNPEVSSVRDSDRILGILASKSHRAELGEDPVKEHLVITRYNPDTRRFVRPVSLGMPFNSPADDFCYVLDATAHQGYLVTNRRQPSDRVCRYTFLFDTPNFEELTTDDHQLLRHAAALHSVAESQAGQAARIAQHRQFLATQKRQHNEVAPPDFTFVIDDDHLATSLADFQSETGRRLAAQWLDLTEQSREVARQREEAERRYAKQRNEADAQTLRRTELTLTRLHQEIKTIAKEIRRAEQR